MMAKSKNGTANATPVAMLDGEWVIRGTDVRTGQDVCVRIQPADITCADGLSPNGQPDGSRYAVTRILKDLAFKARHMAKEENMCVWDYLSVLLRPIIEQHWEEHQQRGIEEINRLYPMAHRGGPEK